MASNPNKLKKPEGQKPGAAGNQSTGGNTSGQNSTSPLSVTLGQGRPVEGGSPAYQRDVMMDDEPSTQIVNQPKGPVEKNLLVEDLDVHGDVPQARFGHTITIVAKQKVVLFGGATGDTGKYSMTGETFMYNILSKNWQKLQGKLSPVS